MVLNRRILLNMVEQTILIFAHLARQTGPAGIVVKREGGVFQSPGIPHHQQNPTVMLDRIYGTYEIANRELLSARRS